MPVTLATAVGRIRYAVGDTDDDAVLMPPGGYYGAKVYSDLLAQHGGSEVGAWRAAAGLLAAYYATQPTSIGDAGSSVAWSERVRSWQAMASGATPYPVPASAPALPTMFSLAPGRRGR